MSKVTSPRATKNQRSSSSTPPLINILVEERDSGAHQLTEQSPIFQAACLFKQGNFEDQYQSSSQNAAQEQQESAEEMPLNICPITPIMGGFADKMAPILEDISMQKDDGMTEIQASKEIRSQICGAVTMMDNLDLMSQKPEQSQRRKSIPKPSLDLDRVIKQSIITIGSSTSRQKDAPPMSSRRMKQFMPTQQELQIEAKVLEICSSTVMQPVFQAIWKVILTMCYEKRALRAYMRKKNLITVPIRTVHFNEILHLFRKAHGPLLQIKKVDNTSTKTKNQKKASLVTANETVQGFAHYSTFCQAFVRMLGDGILLLNPDLYTVVVQLVFEAVSIQTKTKRNEPIIYLRRITDVTSPFLSPITDNLPVYRIFTLETLEQVVKHFCMKEVLQKELDRLTERRFRPSALVNKDTKTVAPGEQLYDSIELMLKYSNWQSIRLEKMSNNTTCLPESELIKTNRNASTMKRITHASKHERTVAIPDFSRVQMMDQSESAGHCPSEMDSEDGRGHEYYSSLQPKLPNNNRDRETPLMIASEIRYTTFAQDRQPMTRVEAVKPLGTNNTQFHIKIGDAVPRTPQEGARRLRFTEREPIDNMFRVSQHSVTDQQTELAQSNRGKDVKDDKFSFQGGNVANNTSRNDRRDVLSQCISSNGTSPSFVRRIKETPLTLMDAMHKNHKIKKLSQKTKKLNLVNDIQSLQQFAVHRDNFDKVRNNNMQSTRSDENPASSNADTFHIQINSKGKLDELPTNDNSDTKPIAELQQEICDEVDTKANSDGKHEMEELKLETGQMISSEQKKNILGPSLFDFKPLLIQNTILRSTHDTQSVFDEDVQTPRSMEQENPCDLTFKQEEQQACQNKDYLNYSKTYNSKNLQAARLKNKRSIADNVRHQNELLQQKGYNICQLTGRRLGNTRTSHRRRKQSHVVNNIAIPKIGLDNTKHGASTDRRSPRSQYTQRTQHRNQPNETLKFDNTFGENLVSEVSEMTQPPTGHLTPVPGNKIEGVTLDSYIMSLHIINGPGCATSKPVSRGTAVGGPWGRRMTNPFSQPSRLGVTSHSQRPRLRSIGSPYPESEFSRRTGTQNGTRGKKQQGTEQDFGEAIFCKTIPTMVKEYQSRINEKGVGTMDDIYHAYMPQQIPESSNAIPIRLHLAQASMNERDQFSSFRHHGEMRDSLTAPSRTSREPEREIITNNLSRGEDDGICTVRAESNLDKVTLENALKQANISENFNEHKVRMKSGNTTRQKTAKIVLVTPKPSLHLQKPDFQLALQQPSMLKQNTQPVSTPTETNSGTVSPYDRMQLRITDNNLQTRKLNQVSEANTSGMFSTIPGGTVNIKLMHQLGSGIGSKQLAEYSVGVGRARMVSTADHQCRPKVAQNLEHREKKAMQQYKSEAEPEDLGQVTELRSTHIESLLAKDHNVADDVSLREPGSGTRKNMNFGDIGRWQASLENPGLMMDNSDKSGFQSIVTPAQVTQPSEAVSSVNYTRQKPRDASDIDLSTSSQPQNLMNSAIIDLSRRMSRPHPPTRQHEQLYQKGEFIAPRRAMTRNKQRLNIKTPINLLALHDHKNMKNLNLTSCNKDLITSKFETDTLNLSPTNRSPDGRLRNRRHNSVYEVKSTRLAIRKRKEQHMKDVSTRRTPTPIKIVDLSARAGPLVHRKLSIQQEYMQQFPKLKNPDRPLMQDVLRQMNGGSLIGTQPDGKTLFRRPTNDVTVESNTAETNSSKAQMSQKGSGAINLRKMVGFLVRSPQVVPENIQMAPMSTRSFN